MSFASMHNAYLEHGNPMLEDEPPCENCLNDLGADCSLVECDYKPKDANMTVKVKSPYSKIDDNQPLRGKILDEVKKTICQDRQDVHGNPEHTHEVIAEFWNAYIYEVSRKEDDFKITAQDVAVMMCLFKIARHAMNPNHSDNLHDLIGYAAIAAELGSTSQPLP